MQGFERGCLRLAMITTARYFATRMIGDFCRDHPKVELVLEVVNRDQILERMRAKSRRSLHHGPPAGRPGRDSDSLHRKSAGRARPRRSSALRGKAIEPERLDSRSVHPARARFGNASGDRTLFRRSWHQPADAHDARQRRNHQAGLSPPDWASPSCRVTCWRSTPPPAPCANSMCRVFRSCGNGMRCIWPRKSCLRWRQLF